MGRKNKILVNKNIGKDPKPSYQQKINIMSGPFKMKGSPMKRNFGIGASPAKHPARKSSGAFEEQTGSEEIVDTHEHPHTKEVDETAEYYKEEEKKRDKVRKRNPATEDIRTREEIRNLNL